MSSTESESTITPKIAGPQKDWSLAFGASCLAVALGAGNPEATAVILGLEARIWELCGLIADSGMTVEEAKRYFSKRELPLRFQSYDFED